MLVGDARDTEDRKANKSPTKTLKPWLLVTSETLSKKVGGRYWVRTNDFHRVKVTLYR